MKTTMAPPLGYVTAREAANRLNIHIDSFYRRLRKKQASIKKISPFGTREGYYLKKDVDAYARQLEMGALAEHGHRSEFKCVTTEEELRGIVDLCVPIYGVENTPTFEHRLGLWLRNPEIYYVVVKAGIVVGYISITWLREDLKQAFMEPCGKARSEILATMNEPETIHPFCDGMQIDHLFASTSVLRGFDLLEKRQCGMLIARNVLDVLIRFLKRGMPVRSLIACSSRANGIRMARDLGMREIVYNGDPEIRFELDLATSTVHSLAHYREALANRI